MGYLVEDCHHRTVTVGDIVYIPCEVLTLNPGGDEQNLGLETVHPSPVDGAKTRLSVHARQVVVEAPAELPGDAGVVADPDPEAEADAEARAVAESDLTPAERKATAKAKRKA